MIPDRERIIAHLREGLMERPGVHAAWLEGADALDAVDEWSDIDVVVDADDGRAAGVLDEIRELLGRLAPLDWVSTTSTPAPGLLQQVVHLRGTPESLLIDVVVQAHSRAFEFVEGHPSEAALALFDHSGVLRFRRIGEAELSRSVADGARAIANDFRPGARVRRYIRRGRFLEALAAYRRYVLDPLVRIQRLRHAPFTADYGLVHIERHLPGDVVRRLEALHGVATTDEIEAALEEAEEWFHETAAACAEGRSEGDAAEVPPGARLDSGTVDTPAGPLYHETRGQGAAVVLLHGGNLDRRMWDPQFEMLSARFRAIRYDIRPFGRSSPATAPYSDEEDLRRLLDHLGVASATLVGLSLGGRVAVNFALAHPARVERLVLAGPGLSGFAFSGGDERGARYRAAFARGGGAELVEEWLRDPYMAPAMERAELAPLLRAIAQENAGAWLPENRVHPATEPDPPAIGRLAEIRAPTLIVIGERDVPDIHAIGELLVERVPNASRVVIPGAGHIVNLEARTGFDELVLSFLTDAPRANAP